MENEKWVERVIDTLRGCDSRTIADRKILVDAAMCNLIIEKHAAETAKRGEATAHAPLAEVISPQRPRYESIAEIANRTVQEMNDADDGYGH